METRGGLGKGLRGGRPRGSVSPLGPPLGGVDVPSQAPVPRTSHQARPGKERPAGAPFGPAGPRGGESRPVPVPSLRGYGEVIGADSGCGPSARPAPAPGPGGAGDRAGSSAPRLRLQHPAAAPPGGSAAPSPGSTVPGHRRLQPTGRRQARTRRCAAPAAPTWPPAERPETPSISASGAPSAGCDHAPSLSGHAPRSGPRPRGRHRCPWQRRRGDGPPGGAGGRKRRGRKRRRFQVTAARPGPGPEPVPGR